MGFAGNLRQQRKARGWTQAQLAQRLGVTASTVAMWETGKRVPPAGKGRVLAEMLGTTLDGLLGEAAAGRGNIPVLGRVAAGQPMQATQEVLDWEPPLCSAHPSGEYFALQIQGQSMSPRMQPGDVVIVRRQEDCSSGEVAVVLVGDEEATVKRVKKDASGLRLVPNNPAFEPICFSWQEVAQLPVRILGVVVELRGKSAF